MAIKPEYDSSKPFTVPKIKEIVLELGEKKISLSLEEAQGLKKVLNDTFPEKTPVIPYTPPIIIDRPYRPYPYPAPQWTCTTTFDQKQQSM